MKLTELVQQCIKNLDWNDEIEIDEEKKESNLKIKIEINNQTFNLFFETDEQRDLLKIYLYAPFECLTQKRDDCIKLFNRINLMHRFGAICLLDDDAIAYRHIIDVEDSDSSVEMIDNMINSAISLYRNWFDEISSVALTKKTVRQIFEELDAPSKEENVPDSI